MRRATLFLLILAGLQAPLVHAGAPAAATHRIARAVHQVQITPTQLAPGETSIDFGTDRWTLQGYDLRGLLAHVYGIDPARVDLDGAAPVPAGQTSGATESRFDVSLALAGNESDEAIQSLLRSAIEERFHLKTSLETRSREVYVMTAPFGAGKGLQAVADLHIAAKHADATDSDAPSIITVAGRVCPGISSAGITAESATLARLASALGENLDRLVLDETNLTRAYDFQVPEYRSREELFSLLHDRLGVTVNSGRREVQVLAVRSAGQPSTAMVAGL